jgi:hypothetical protein
MKLKRIITLSLITSVALFAGAPDFFNLKERKQDNIDIAKEAQTKRIATKSADIVSNNSDKQIEQEIMQPEYHMDDKDPQVVLLNKMKDKKKFNLKTKKMFIDKDVKFVKIKIPIHQMSEILVDKQIVKIDFLENPKMKITLDQEEAQKLTFINKDLNLDQNIKITFIDGSTINLLLGLGNAISERHIEYKLYFEKKKVALLPEFQKKLKIRNVHTYFNNVATKLIIDKILQKDSFTNIEENKKKIDQILFDGTSVFDTVSGEIIQDYKLTLNYVYETPFIEDTQKENIKKRLVMLEMTIENKSDDSVLALTPEFIKKRFGNYVAMYIGDLDTKQNYIPPKSNLRFLLVIEDKVKEDEIN